jgi:hypothetical protein
MLGCSRSDGYGGGRWGGGCLEKAGAVAACGRGLTWSMTSAGNGSKASVIVAGGCSVEGCDSDADESEDEKNGGFHAGSHGGR